MTVERQLRIWLVGLLVFLVLVYMLRGILLPFVAGMVVAYLLDPACDRLERAGLSRTLATAVLTVLFLLAVVAILLLLVPAMAGQLVDLIRRVPALVEALRGQFTELVAVIQARVDPELLARLETSLAGSTDQLVQWTTGLLGRVISGGVALFDLISLLVITPVVTFYLLRDWDRIIAKIDSWLPRRQADTIRQLARETDSTLSGFLRGQGTVCLILGIFYAIGLTLAGLDFGLVIGLIAGLLSFIPYLGATIGLVASVGFALLQFDDWLRIVIVAAIFFAGQAVEGNFLTPKLVGGRVGLHPVWVIFGLLAGGAIFGFVGVLLALPLAAVVGVGVRFALGRYLASPLYHGGVSESDDGGEAESR